MKIIGAQVKFIRQLNGGQGSRKAPGFYSERSALVEFGDGELFGDCVQRAFVGVKAQACADLTIPPNSELR